jgi:hypothetical protein
LIFASVGCEPRWTTNIGLSRSRGDRFLVHIFACAGGEQMQVILLLDPDQIPDGDETELWGVTGSTTSKGAITFELGQTPPGFRENVAFSRPLRTDTRYALELRWDRQDQGMTFVPADFAAEGIQIGGELVPAEKFVEIAEEACD